MPIPGGAPGHGALSGPCPVPAPLPGRGRRALGGRSRPLRPVPPSQRGAAAAAPGAPPGRLGAPPARGPPAALRSGTARPGPAPASRRSAPRTGCALPGWARCCQGADNRHSCPCFPDKGASASGGGGGEALRAPSPPSAGLSFGGKNVTKRTERHGTGPRRGRWHGTGRDGPAGPGTARGARGARRGRCPRPKTAPPRALPVPG